MPVKYRCILNSFDKTWSVLPFLTVLIGPPDFLTFLGMIFYVVNQIYQIHELRSTSEISTCCPIGVEKS